LQATFRVDGKEAELWHPETGSTEPASFTAAAGRTTVPLQLEPWGTVFVVFAKPTGVKSRTVPVGSEEKLATVDGPWSVTFEAGRGAPGSISMATLSDWSKSADPGVKYFSGTGTYTKSVRAAADWFKEGKRLWIDLGDVKNIAVVTVNGKKVGESWHAPYRLDVTAELRPGENEIKIEVVDSWVNRLIGDEQPGATRITFTDVKPYKASSPLTSAGLLGPVVFLRTGNR